MNVFFWMFFYQIKSKNNQDLQTKEIFWWIKLSFIKFVFSLEMEWLWQISWWFVSFTVVIFFHLCYYHLIPWISWHWTFTLSHFCSFFWKNLPTFWKFPVFPSIQICQYRIWWRYPWQFDRFFPLLDSYFWDWQINFYIYLIS